MTVRRTLAALIGAALLLAACGKDIPSRDDYIGHVRDQIGTEAITTLEKSGISRADAESVYDDFIGCIYDSIKDDEEVLNQAYDNQAAVQATIDEKSAGCNDDLIAAAAKATASAGG